MKVATLTALALSVGLAFPVAAAPGALRSSLSIDPPTEGDLELAVHWSLTNTSQQTLYVLSWQTPLRGLEADLFEVERDGEALPYIGKQVKRPQPTAADYVRLEPGQTVDTWITGLPSAYDFSSPGEYTLRYDVPVVQALRSSSARSGDPIYLLPQLESNPVSLITTAPLEDLQNLMAPSSQFTLCRKSQQEQLLTALDNAGMISDLAVAQLEANPDGSDLYTYWFGTYTQIRFSTVQDHFLAIADALNTKPVTFNCGCTMSAYAYVYANDPYNIYLCRAFWKAPPLGRDSQAGTLVHETSHFTVVAGTDDYVYGESGAHQLAVTNPQNAIDNADNHEYFAEDQL